MKFCQPCDSLKENVEFAKNKNSADGFQTSCKKCQQKYREANFERIQLRKVNWVRDNPEKQREYGRQKRAGGVHFLREKNRNLKRSYGISLVDFNNLLSKQSGKCNICELPMLKPQVDHCHATKKVRGLLCQLCNTNLGRFKDSVKLLRAAITHLEA